MLSFLKNKNHGQKNLFIKKNALRALKNKVTLLHGGGQSGEVSFTTLRVEGSNLIAISSYWEDSTLQEWLDGKRKLEH